MLEQFQKILESPRPNSEFYLKKVQDAMLNTLQNLLPSDFDFSELAKIFEIQNSEQNLPSLTYKLTEYFISIVNDNFISLSSYFSLEQQTQKLQSTVRGHIKVTNNLSKMQQQMKMYLEHLEYKIERYDFHLNKLRSKNIVGQNFPHQSSNRKQKENIDELRKRQTNLLKQRLVLLKKVDHLQKILKDQQIQLKRLHSPTSGVIKKIKQDMYTRIKLLQQMQNGQQQFCDNLMKTNQQVDRRNSSYSLASDNQITQKKTSMPNNTTHNYKLNQVEKTDQIEISHQVGMNDQEPNHFNDTFSANQSAFHASHNYPTNKYLLATEILNTVLN